jgi:transposase
MNDERVYLVTPPWERRSKHFTREFEAFAVTLMREMPVKRAGQILGESDSRMWRMLCPCEGGACAVELRQRGVGGSGRDEPAQKAHYLMVLSDLITKRVLFAMPGKDFSVWGHLL